MTDKPKPPTPEQVAQAVAVLASIPDGDAVVDVLDAYYAWSSYVEASLSSFSIGVARASRVGRVVTGEELIEHIAGLAECVDAIDRGLSDAQCIAILGRIQGEVDSSKVGALRDAIRSVLRHG